MIDGRLICPSLPNNHCKTRKIMETPFKITENEELENKFHRIGFLIRLGSISLFLLSMYFMS